MWLAICIVCIGLALIYLQRKLTYWQVRGVKVPAGYPIIGHGYDLLIKPYSWQYVQKCYNEMVGEPYWGMYEMGAPRLFIRDLDIIKDITIKDFGHFVDRRRLPFNKEHSELDLMFSESLFSETGEKWKKLRALLSPTFTSGKIKAMYSTIQSKTEEMISYLELLRQRNECVEMRHPVGKYTLSVIASSSFGMELPIDGSYTDFDKYVHILGKLDLTLVLKMFALYNFPVLGSLFGVQLINKEMVYFYEVLERACNYRKTNNVRRDDFLDLMNDLREESEDLGSSKYRMTMRSLVSQSILFISAGYDTTANTLGFAFYLLAKYPRVQEKLRRELQDIHESGEGFSYQSLVDAKYLDAVLAEVLRIYPQCHLLERLCTRDYKVEKTGLVIPKGSLVVIPAYSLHHDEKYWRSPNTFKPERFLAENKHEITPYAYCPFGYGPRNCIGVRFAQVEMKVAIAKLLMEYRLSLPANEDLILDTGVFVMKATDHGVHINLQKA